MKVARLGSGDLTTDTNTDFLPAWRFIRPVRGDVCLQAFERGAKKGIAGVCLGAWKLDASMAPGLEKSDALLHPSGNVLRSKRYSACFSHIKT